MKKISWFTYLSMLACALLLPSCQDDDKRPATPGDVRFTVRSRALDNEGGRVSSSVLPTNGKLYVTVLKSNGEVVFDLQEIPFVMVGDYVVSEPMPLAPGDYAVTQFIISSEDDGTYAAPVEGSSVAQWVDDPLPIPFTVSNDNLTNVQVQVLPFNDEVFTPEDFGYVTFSVGVAPYPYFKLAVFKPGPNGPELDAVQAYLLDGADTLVNKALPPGTHAVAFKGERSKAYTLVLEDDTYGIYAQSFVLDSLLTRLHGEPWAVTMKPALTMVATEGNGDETFFGFFFSGWRGMVSVDWGDGTQEEYDNVDGGTDVNHEYSDTKPRVISITGDLADVWTLMLHPWSGTRALQLDHMTSLQYLKIDAPQSPRVIDIRNSPWIGGIVLPGTEVETILFPEHPQIGWLDINDTPFTSATLNDLVHLLYATRVYHDVTLNIANTQTDPPEFIAPLSAQSLEELRVLRDEYEWNIMPSNF